MRRQCRYLPEARNDLFAAVRYYEGQEAGLGGDFLDEVVKAARDACEFPGRWPTFRGRVRKRSTNRFPYSLLYVLDGQVVVIVAVADMRRGPRWFRKRLNDWK